MVGAKGSPFRDVAGAVMAMLRQPIPPSINIAIFATVVGGTRYAMHTHG